MKSRKIQIFCLFAVVLGAAAWAPSSNEDIIMGTGNAVTSVSGYVGVIGGGNKVNAASSLVLGENNKISHDGTNATTPAAWRTFVTGDNNILNNGGSNTVVGGYGNTSSAHNSLLVGQGNNINGGTFGSVAYNSSAIGAGNLQAATYGWAMGMNNKVYGNLGVTIGSTNKVGTETQPNALESVAIGSDNTVSNDHGYAFGRGLLVTQPESVAIGMWNTSMAAGDVMVVGAGTSTTRRTALRVTSDGGVILGRAQGDIAMGDYQ